VHYEKMNKKDFCFYKKIIGKQKYYML
jgi:hypothetical protein